MTGLATATLAAAAARSVATRKGLIRDSLAEPLVRAVGVDVYTRVAEGEPDVAELSDHGDYIRLTDCVAARTRYFDGFFADAGIAGIRQAVILASGLDTRPYRLWWPSQTTVFDVDQPQVVEFKTQTLRRLDVTPTTTRRALGVTLSQDWPAALRRIGFDSTQPTAWIAEGLPAAFQSPGAQHRLLNNITDLSADGSRFAADYDGHSEQDEIANYLSARGWVTVGSTLADLLAACGLPSLRADEGARAPVPTRYVTALRNAAKPKTLDS